MIRLKYAVRSAVLLILVLHSVACFPYYDNDIKVHSEITRKVECDELFVTTNMFIRHTGRSSLWIHATSSERHTVDLSIRSAIVKYPDGSEIQLSGMPKIFRTRPRPIDASTVDMPERYILLYVEVGTLQKEVVDGDELIAEIEFQVGDTQESCHLTQRFKVEQANKWKIHVGPPTI